MKIKLLIVEQGEVWHAFETMSHAKGGGPSQLYHLTYRGGEPDLEAADRAQIG